MLKICHFFIVFLSIVVLMPAFCTGEGLQDAIEEDDGFEFEEEFMDEELADTYDPLMGINRGMFIFNDKFYFWLLKPVAKGYGYILPESARKGVNRFFLNLSFPKRFVNNVLQFKISNAGIELARFGVNTTIGILGFMDPAEKWMGLSVKDEDFGQTFGVYGFGEGFPLVLPFLGVSNLRDAIGLIPDIFLNPLFFVPNSLYLSIGLVAYEKMNYVSLHIGEYEAIKSDALDPYTFIRDGYAQNRRKKIEE